MPSDKVNDLDGVFKEGMTLEEDNKRTLLLEKLSQKNMRERNELQIYMCGCLAGLLDDFVPGYSKECYDMYVIMHVLGEKFAIWFEKKIKQNISVREFVEYYSNNLIQSLCEVLGVSDLVSFMQSKVEDFSKFCLEMGYKVDQKTVHNENSRFNVKNIGDEVRSSVTIVNQ